MKYLAIATMVVASAACGTHGQCVVIELEGAVTTASFKDGSGGWQPLALISGRGEVCATADYQVMVTCARASGGTLVVQSARMVDDGDLLLDACGDPPASALHVTGTLAEPGTVSIGTSTASGLGSPWLFDIGVPEGTYDVIATDRQFPDTASKLAIRRGVRVDASLGPLALDLADAVSLVDVSLTVEGMFPGEDLVTSALLDTSGTFEQLSTQPGATVRMVPGDALLDSDRQYLGVTASTASTVRGVTTTEPATSFVLPPLVDGTEFGADELAASVRWDTLPAFDLDQARLAATRAQDVVLVVASRGWLDATAASSLSLDTTAPGLTTATIIHTGEASSLSLELTSRTQTSVLTTARRR